MGDGVSMEKIRNLSLKKTMVLYTILSLIVTFFLSVSIIEIAGQIQEEVWWKYVDQDEYYQAMNDRNENFEVVVPRPNQSKMSRMDWHISETCDFLQTYGVLLFSFAGCGIAVSLFYKNKLKRPIQELRMASQMNAEEELDFHMAYENEDEMGMLCREFERMRGQLEENNRRLWQMIEDERVLRAAIAHDIRSPLAIMRGYQEMLLEFVPEDMLDQEKMMEMLRGGMLQIERMNHFIDIQNPDKIEECVLVGGINCLPDTAFEQMEGTKNIFHKTGKRQGYHVIISFSPEEKVTSEQAMYVLEHFAKDVLGDDYEAVYAVHTDREHMHGHLIWNSVSMTTGKKYNSHKNNWKNHLQPITNKYCDELGLSIMPAEYSRNPKNISRDKWEKEMSMKEIILRDAKMCAYAAGNMEHFKYLMKRLGYVFKKDAWMEVQAPGFRYYGRFLFKKGLSKRKPGVV